MSQEVAGAFLGPDGLDAHADLDLLGVALIHQVGEEGGGAVELDLDPGVGGLVVE